MPRALPRGLLAIPTISYRVLQGLLEIKDTVGPLPIEGSSPPVCCRGASLIRGRILIGPMVVLLGGGEGLPAPPLTPSKGPLGTAGVPRP